VPLPPGALLTSSEVIALLRISRSLFFALVADGEIEVLRLGRRGSRRKRVLVPRESLDRYLAQLRAAGAPRAATVDPDAILARIRSGGSRGSP